MPRWRRLSSELMIEEKRYWLALGCSLIRAQPASTARILGAPLYNVGEATGSTQLGGRLVANTKSSKARGAVMGHVPADRQVDDVISHCLGILAVVAG